MPMKSILKGIRRVTGKIYDLNSRSLQPLHPVVMPTFMVSVISYMSISFLIHAFAAVMLFVSASLLLYSAVIVPFQICMWDYTNPCNIFPTLRFDMCVDTFFMVRGAIYIISITINVAFKLQESGTLIY